MGYWPSLAAQDDCILASFFYGACAWPRRGSGARFSKATETFWAHKAIFSSSVSKNGEVYTPETSCMKRTCVHINYLKVFIVYLQVRDCCECFVFNYTHALTVQCMRNFQYCTKRSWVQYWKFRVHCTVSKCVYLKTKHELTVSNPFNIQSEFAAGDDLHVKWLPARPEHCTVFMRYIFMRYCNNALCHFDVAR